MDETVPRHARTVIGSSGITTSDTFQGMLTSPPRVVVFLLPLVLVALGCGDDEGTGASAGSSSAPSSTGSGAGGSSTSSTSSTSTTSSSTSTSGTSMGECTPGEIEDCYSGPPETLDVGICHAGTRTCEPDGTFGACFDQQTPLIEQCQTEADENCSGVTEPCDPGTFLFARAWLPASGGTAGVVDLKRDELDAIHVLGSTSNAAAVDLGNGVIAPDGAFIAALDDAGAALDVVAWTSRGSLAQGPAPADVLLSGGGRSGLLNIASTWPARAYESSYAGEELVEWTIGNALGTPGGPDTCYSFIYATQRAPGTTDLFVGGLYREDVTIDGTSLTTSDDEHDLMIARLDDPSGTASYISTIQTNQTARAAIALTPDGDVVLLAHVLAPLTHLGVPIDATGHGYLLAKFDGVDGTLLWTEWMPTNVNTNISCNVPLHELEVSSDGSIFAHMRGNVTIDGITYPSVVSMARFDQDGNPVWVHPVTNAIAQTPNLGLTGVYPSGGGVYWVLEVNGILDYGAGSLGAYSSNGGTDPIIVRLDLDTGALLWGQHLPMDGFLGGAVVTAEEGLLVGGQFTGNAVIGGIPFDAGTTTAGWLTKLTP